MIFIILVGGWLAGRLFTRVGLPGVLGMTLLGIALSFVPDALVPPVLTGMSPFLKSLALIIILLRAGLGINRKTLAKVGKTSLFMSFVPCLFEAGALTLLLHFFVGFSYVQGAVLGFLLAAVSPAVVVPSMLVLKDRGIGQEKDVPTLILAGASLDDVFAITLMMLFADMAAGHGAGSVGMSLLKIPYSLLLGILPGIIVGTVFVVLFRRFHTRIRATEKALLILGSGVMLVQVGDWIHTATLLGVMTMGFILLEWAEPVAHELASKMSKAWVFAEIVLFVFIGMSVDVHLALGLGGHTGAGWVGLLVISGGLAARSLGVLSATIGSGLNMKERLFCVFSYLPKATVQAAMGSVPLAMGIPGGDLMLAYAVLSIVVTAPLGLVLIRAFGPRLLS
ncbi:MAG: cation:proton antiporter [Spirochaetales bacterium]|nr:cation:proton antiporter [Spirochaetales bacterium]